MPMDIAFEKYTLSNGLDVILHDDHSIPIVAVNVWYHVGSKNEEPDRTGFAHLFEHLMFQGSKHHNHEYFGPLQEVGANINGSTSTDRTNYYENVPSNYLELALWLESDRMGFLLDARRPDAARQPARRGQERAPPELREPPYGLAEAGDSQGAVPAEPPLPLADDRLAGAPQRGLARGRARLLPPLLRAQQRHPRRSPATSTRRGEEAGRAVLRRPARRRRRWAASQRWAPPLTRRGAAGAGGPRAALAPLLRLGRAAALRPGRGAAGRARLDPGRGPQLAALPLAGLREADRARGRRLLRVAGDRGRDPHRRDGRARRTAGGGRGDGAAGGDRAHAQRAADGRRGAARGQPPGGALRPSARERWAASAAGRTCSTSSTSSPATRASSTRTSTATSR